MPASSGPRDAEAPRLTIEVPVDLKDLRAGVKRGRVVCRVRAKNGKVIGGEPAKGASGRGAGTGNGVVTFDIGGDGKFKKILKVQLAAHKGKNLTDAATFACDLLIWNGRSRFAKPSRTAADALRPRARTLLRTMVAGPVVQ